MKYIIISEQKALELMGMTSGVNMLMPVKILSGTYIGHYACSEGAEHDFAEIFNKLTPLTKVELAQSEFAKDPFNVKLSGYGIEIPEQFQWVFESDKFVLNDFVIPLVTREGKKYVDIAYFNWNEFRHELDEKDSKGNFVHLALKRSLMPLWEYVGLKASEGGMIEL